LAGVPAAVLVVKPLEHLGRCPEARDVGHADPRPGRRLDLTDWFDQPAQ
jgi:hypothetical protein